MSVLKGKSYKFAVRIVKMAMYLRKNNEFVLSNQVLRSGTAIGALLREAEYAESPIDFAHKLSIARKEANETLYWLSLLKDTNQITQEMFDSINGESEEILKMLTASIKTIKSKIKRKNKPNH